MRDRWVIARATAAMSSLVLGLALASSACSGSGSLSTGSELWTRASVLGFSVSHPVSWRVEQYDETDTFSMAVLFFTNSTVTSPCTTTSNSGGGMSIVCRGGLPHGHLDSGGVLIGWFVGASPDFKDAVNEASGQLTTIDGLRAKIDDSTAEDQCRAEGGTREVTVTIDTPPVPNVVSMVACLADPTPTQRAEVITSARSLQLPPTERR